MVSSGVVCSTITFWNLLSSAPSFSIDLRYSSSVVAPMHCMVPLANAGLSMFAASMVPGADPAPTSVWISSMNTIMLGWFSISFTSAFTLSSNCPRYFVPATSAPRSSVITLLLNSTGEVCFLAMSVASPSTMALFPTPGSPMSIGLFFFLRQSISHTLFISFSLPTMGSSFPSSAASVRSVPKLSSIGVSPPVLVSVAVEPPPCFRFWLPVLPMKSSSSSSCIPMPFFVMLSACFFEYSITWS